MKSILLLLTILLALNAEAQEYIPAINYGKLQVLIKYKDGYFVNTISSCWDYRVFKEKFPDFIIDKKIEDRYKGCRIIKKREEILKPDLIEQETDYWLWRLSKTPIVKRPSWLPKETNDDLLEGTYERTCSHIYVAVMDTVEIRQQHSVLAMSYTGTRILDTMVYPKPQNAYTATGPKIVCILCHRVTNQVLKYEPGGVTMPCGGCGITFDSLENPRPKIGETVKILLTDKN